MKRNSRARRAERIIDGLMCMAVIVGVLILTYVVMLRVLDTPAQGKITPAAMEIYPPRAEEAMDGSTCFPLLGESEESSTFANDPQYRMSAANIVRLDQEQREGPLQYPQAEAGEADAEEPPRESEPPEWVTAPPEQAADLLEPDFSDYGVQLASAEIAGDGTELLEPVEADGKIAGFYRADVPMVPEHQTALFEICAETGVDVYLALGLIETESTFDPYAVSETGCYGYCQLSHYFPSGLEPEDNMRVGIGWLGELIARHGDVEKALTIYHLGSDDGTRTYAGAVLGCAREWGYGG